MITAVFIPPFFLMVSAERSLDSGFLGAGIR
jgi:hypothetical protein